MGGPVNLSACLTCHPVDLVALQLKQQLLLAQSQLLQLEGLVGSHQLGGGGYIRVKWQVASYLRTDTRDTLATMSCL